MKCFLTSFPAPGRGPASPSWGGPMFLLPTLPHCPPGAVQVPNCCLPSPPFTLTSSSSSLDAPASKACPVSPFAAFKLFILYLWFGALRKILIFYLSPLSRSGAGREGGLCVLGCQRRRRGAMPGQCPLRDCRASVPTCLVYILKRCIIQPPRGHHRSQEPSWRTAVQVGSRTDGPRDGADPEPCSLALAGRDPCPPPRRSHPTFG